MWLDVPGLEDPPKEDSLFRTVVHGDAWVNNMMFSSNDPEAVELRLMLVACVVISSAQGAMLLVS